MDYRLLMLEYCKLMQKAEAATSRSEAISCIHQATHLKEAADYAKHHQTTTTNDNPCLQ